MKFVYEEVQTTTYNNGRWYETSDGPFPSITTILGITSPPEKQKSLQNWRDSLGHAKADQVSKAAMDRGTNVHLLAERFLKGEDVEALINGKPVPPADLSSFNALKTKLKKVDEVWGQEVPLWSSVLEVAGRCDLVGKYKGIPCIVDFKTASRVKNDADIHEYKLQLLFYGTAHNEMFGTEIDCGVILMVAEQGMPMEFHVPFTVELMEELLERIDLFYAKAMKNL